LVGGIKIIMGIGKRHLWKIDDVLDHTSNFWDNIEDDMQTYVDSLTEIEVDSISTEKFKTDFTEYFNNIANRTLYKEIKDAEDIVTRVLWNLLGKEDKEDLFHGDIDFFNDWIDNCPKDLLDKYVGRLSKGESIRESIEESLNYSDYFKAANLSPTSVNVSSSFGMLSLCSTNKDVLDNIQKLFETNGNELKSKSEDVVDVLDGEEVILYTYHFSIKKL
tara:strand:- start:363 stop:1019 length:657 start_codon:yes stop_codon:yes gene_type:complete